MTNAELESALRAVTRRLAAVEQELAEAKAEREAAVERQRRQDLRDELAARRHPLDLRNADLGQLLDWRLQVDRATNGHRRRRTG
jgi:hypothetical protein